MSFRSIVRDVRDGFGSLSRRSFEVRLSGHIRGKSHGSVHELHDPPVVIQNSKWASLPPELLRDVIKRLEASESTWPARKHVVACAAVCRSWRDMCKEIVRCPELSGKLTFPVSLKQPGPRDGTIQCFIKRDKSNLTYHLFLCLSPALLVENGKFLLSAKRTRRTTCTEYVISMDADNISRSSSTYIGKLRSNFLGTKFIIYDTQPPYNSSQSSPPGRSKRFYSKKVSPKVPTGSYNIAQVTYELNVLGTRGPRRMHCVMQSIPNASLEPGGSVPGQPELLPRSLEDSFRSMSFSKSIDTSTEFSSSRFSDIMGPRDDDEEGKENFLSPKKMADPHEPLLSAATNSDEGEFEPTEKVHVVGINENDAALDDSKTPPFSWKKLWLFTGPGFLMSIAFLDPGNLEGDLQAGAIAGYSLLWLLFWATAMGLLIQLLSARLGVVTGRHLAELCRDEYPNWARYLLWVMAELALIGSDIQEVIGSAIALKILSHGFLPLWCGVLITASDCFMFLFLESYGVRKLEAVFAVLIATMGLSFAWMFGDTKPSGSELLVGIVVPKLSSKTIQQAVGVVGCIIMPHNVFLHSALVQSRDIDKTKRGRVQEALNYYSIESTLALIVSFIINLFVMTVFAKSFYGTPEAETIGLVNAGYYLQEKYGGGLFPILYIWAIGLLAAGQSSTLTGTYAGQFIMGGFLNLRLKKWIRALITRSCAIIPTIIVALLFDTSDDMLDVLNEWLNVLQSIQIPFAVIPLLYLVSKEDVMGDFKIGPVLKTLAWLVAALVIVINGYLMVEFFSGEARGLLFGSIVSVFTAAYIAFVVYLIWRSVTFSSWFSSNKSKNVVAVVN